MLAFVKKTKQVADKIAKISSEGFLGLHKKHVTHIELCSSVPSADSRHLSYSHCCMERKCFIYLHFVSTREMIKSQ